MVQETDDYILEAQQCFENNEIFYSLADKKNLRLAIKALVQNGMGLAVIGDNESLLTHYSRMLIFRLRKLSKYRMDIFSPTNTDTLLDRFNQLLSNMTMDEARQRPNPEDTATLLVVNDANIVNEEQWVLLMRLLNDFPGVNVRLILFLNKAEWPKYDEVLTPISRQLYRWYLKIPSVSEARALLTVAQANGFQEETKQLLDNVGLGGVLTENSTQNADNLAGNDAELQKAREKLLQQARNSRQKQADKKKTGLSPVLFRNSVLSLAILSLVSLAFVSQLYPQRLAEFKTTISTYLERSEPADEVTAVEHEIAAPSEKGESREAAADSSTENVEVIPNTIADSDVEAIPQSEKPEVAETIVIETDSLSTPLISEPSVTESEPRSEQSPGKFRMLNDISIGVFFVQHAVVTGEDRVTNYFLRYPRLEDAAILGITANNEQAYAIISGPFQTREDATNFTQKEGVPADFWIWESGQLLRWCERNTSCQLRNSQ